MRELRGISIDPYDPCLIGLTQGASKVRQAQRTRTVLQTLRRVQMTSTTAGPQGEAEDAGNKPMQV